MTLKENLTNDIKKNMKEKNSFKVSTLRFLISAIKNEEISKKRQLDNNEIISIIQRQIKQRKESIKEYEKAQRQDLAKKEKDEMNILYEYLPKQASDEEIREIVKNILNDIPDDSKINMGMIMPKALQKLKGKADGKRISKIVLELI